MPESPRIAPNILLVLLDDVGFGQFTTFGGGVPSPTMDRLAAEGLRYNCFHTTGLSSPTRAALITGRNHYSAAFAGIAECATGYDGYCCALPRSCGTLGEVLRLNGYATAWIGKNHNTPTANPRAGGPLDRWPDDLGFDYFYGFDGAEAHADAPLLYEGRTLLEPFDDRGGRLTADLADKAIAWVRKAEREAPERPWFLYVAPGPARGARHAPKSWLERFKGRFDVGWDAYRAVTLARQKVLGVVPTDTRLTERSHGLPAWCELPGEQRSIYARTMEAYAACAAHCDHEMGRIVEAVKRLPGADDTLILYIAGDSGAGPAGGFDESLEEALLLTGLAHSWRDPPKVANEPEELTRFDHFPAAWAHAMNAPFQWTRQVASHFGATRTPMLVSWPARIADRGGLRSQFLHAVDIAPTLYELCDIDPPAELKGVTQKPIEGVSFAFTFDAPRAPSPRLTQYFELGGARGLYHDGWMASSPSAAPWDPIPGEWDPDRAPWELYRLDHDFSQANDLAKAHPEKLAELKDLWWTEASRSSGRPLDWRGKVRMNADAMGWPSPERGRTRLEGWGGRLALPEPDFPAPASHSWTITAEVDLPDDRTEGMIVTHGGLEGGYGLYLREGRPTFVYDFPARERPTFAAADPLPPGRHTVVVDFAWDALGGRLSLTADGRQIAGGRLDRTAPVQFTLGEGLDIGMDGGAPIDPTYEPPFKFTGRIEKVVIEPKAD